MAARDITLGEAPKPESLLRPHWSELVGRLWADHVTDKLYERSIISKRHKDEIEQKASRDRRKGAELLLNVMLTSSWEQCTNFAVIISQTDGVMKDLGDKLLADLEDTGENRIGCGMVGVIYFCSLCCVECSGCG